MTSYQRMILLRIKTGKTYKEIAKDLGVQPQSLYTALYRMKQAGIAVDRQLHAKLPISPMQQRVLYLYMENMPVWDIAALLKIRYQTVLNHASAGFKLLGLTTPGIDRIAALRAVLEPVPAARVTMDDPAFN